MENNLQESKLNAESLKSYAPLIITVVIAVVVVLVGVYFTNTLSGTYESGQYAVVFQRSGDCTWHQDGYVFHGSYKRQGEVWSMEIQGQGLFMTTEFTIMKGPMSRNGEQVAEKDDLVITGGVLNQAVFKPAH